MTAPFFTETQAAGEAPRAALYPPPTLRPTLSEFLRYLACSALALGADFAIYSLAMHLGLPYPAAAAMGFCVGLWTAYSTSVRFAFAQRTLNDKRVEFALFAVIGLFGLLLTEAILWLLVEHMGSSAYAAKLVAAGLVFLSNFTLRKLLLFRRRPVLREQNP